MYYNIKEEKNYFIVNFNGEEKIFSNLKYAHEYINLRAQHHVNIQLSEIEQREYKKMILKKERIEKLKKLNLKNK